MYSAHIQSDFGLNFHWQCSGDWDGAPTRLYGLTVDCVRAMLSRLSRVQFFATLWTVACQAPLSVGFYKEEYWSGLPRPSPGDLPDPGVEPMSLMCQEGGYIIPESVSQSLLYV